MAMWDKLRRVVQRTCKSSGVFGEPITWHPGGAGSVTTTPSGNVLLGVFVEPHTEVSEEREVQVSTTNPQLDVTDEDLPSGEPLEDDEVTVRGVRYELVQRIEDGQGMSALLLNRPAT